MKLKVYENRQLEIIQEIGTQNENNVELIELEVPEKYIDWNKKLVFVLDNEVYWDFVQDETYLINRAISQHKEVGIYVWLTNNEEDFRSVTKTMQFNSNVDASEQITPEEEAEANRFIAYIEAEKQELDALIDEVQTKLDNGEFNGADGKDGKDGVDGQPGKDGKDGSNGFSPTIRTIETTDGYDIEITDINGTRTITIVNGKDGKNGLNGQDGKDGVDGKDGADGQDGAKGEKGDPGNPGATGNGIASIVKTNTSGLIDTYTITFTDGTTTTFQVTNGQNGQPGANGQDGRDGINGVDGQDGQDGYTPVRGTDYWTSSDIAAIESYCANYIDANITQVLGGSY